MWKIFEHFRYIKIKCSSCYWKLKITNQGQTFGFIYCKRWIELSRFRSSIQNSIPIKIHKSSTISTFFIFSGQNLAFALYQTGRALEFFLLLEKEKTKSFDEMKVSFLIYTKTAMNDFHSRS